MDVEVDAVASLRCNDVFSNHQRSPRSHCSHHEMHFILSYLALLISFSFLSSTAFLPSRPSVRLMLRRHADASVRETLQARVLEGVNAERMLKSAIVSEKENKVFVQTSSSAPLAHPTHCSGIILLCLYTIKPQTPIDFVNQSLGLLVDCSSPKRGCKCSRIKPGARGSIPHIPSWNSFRFIIFPDTTASGSLRDVITELPPISPRSLKPRTQSQGVAALPGCPDSRPRSDLCAARSDLKWCIPTLTSSQTSVWQRQRRLLHPTSLKSS